MDEILHHLKKPWNDDSPVNTNKQWLPMVSRISSIHSIVLHRGSEMRELQTYKKAPQGEPMGVD